MPMARCTSALAVCALAACQRSHRDDHAAAPSRAQARVHAGAAATSHTDGSACALGSENRNGMLNFFTSLAEIYFRGRCGSVGGLTSASSGVRRGRSGKASAAGETMRFVQGGRQNVMVSNNSGRGVAALPRR